MPNISDEDELTLFDASISITSGIVSQLASVGQGLLSVQLGTQVLRLRKIHKRLASRLKEIKVLVALQDDSDANLIVESVVVKAATENVRVFIVDHRPPEPQSVEAVAVERVATNQDFCEAVYDEAAGFFSGHATPSDLYRISELLK